MRNSTFADNYLLLIIVVALLYAAYWINYGSYAYTHYLSRYYDLGLYVYSSYWHLHSTGMGFLQQYLTSTNHLSPFSTLILPLFALYQQPITVLATQDLMLALTAVVLYLVCRDLSQE